MFKKLIAWLFPPMQSMEDFFVCDECMEPCLGLPHTVRDRFGLSEVCAWCAEVLIRNTGAHLIERNRK